ncbi:MAG: endonuclease/exonuclease/phosphatase family protein [Roseovarius sp.]
MLAGLIAVCPVQAETILRVATYNTELARGGPGLLLRDILTEQDPQAEAVARNIARARPDIIVLQGVDHDHDLRALQALRSRIEEHGHFLPHVFAARPNTGMATGLDLDGDGRTGRARDAQGYGEFAGQGGMAVLSKFPILTDEVRDFSAILWRDLPDASLWLTDGNALLPADVADIQRLSTVAHWDVPVLVDDVRLNLLTFHASPPVFDGPEDRNGRRNHDEIVFWRHYLDGRLGPPPSAPFVLVGDANLDPADGDGRKVAIRRLLSDDRLKDPQPRRPGIAVQGAGQRGDPRLDTVNWPEPAPGALRVSYVLPSADLAVKDAAIMANPDETSISTASRHRLVWVDLVVK